MSTGEESDQVAQRRANLDALKKLGVDPYPHRFDTQATVAAIVGEHGAKSVQLSVDVADAEEAHRNTLAVYVPPLTTRVEQMNLIRRGG